MRFILKGGAWKNSEDEILKAAVMKYGLNQWSRISSLLVRKSARQCKERWYEWLDPSINKTEWTREEEEKLLHLAKIFPSQWRTIAPIVGRSPAQCVDHYEKLLDQAQGKEDNDENDPRKLKPGEIDPHPETKPAKPDPIDMDEDEKEMIAEARVRLANTKGKKAKRKAREKTIEEARRLAQLQKQRELKAAGIDIVIPKKVKGINYNEEIPFERTAPDFTESTGPEEDPKPSLRLGNISLQQLEGNRRDDDEEKLRKIDIKKMKKLKEIDLPSAIDKLNKFNPKLLNIKTQLILPEPQINDKDLELLGKLNNLQNPLGKKGAKPTTTLLGDYSITEKFSNIIRTPSSENAIINEAQKLYNLQSTQTPLIGGVMPQDISISGSSNIGNQNIVGGDSSKVSQTPNILSTILRSSGPSSIINSSSVNRSMKRNLDSLHQTPIRDELKINWEDNENEKSWENSSVAISEESSMKKNSLQLQETVKRKMNLKLSLKNLPKAMHEYQLDIPELDESMKREEIAKDLDSEIQEVIKKKAKAKELEKKLKMRSLAIQKNLPRPYKINKDLYSHIIDDSNIKEERRMSEKILAEEIIEILANDSQQYPLPNCYPEKSKKNFEIIDQEDLNGAKHLIKEEIDNIKKELMHGNLSKEALESSWIKNLDNLVFDKKENKFKEINLHNDPQYIESLKQKYSKLYYFYEKQQSTIEKLEKQIKILISGQEKKVFGLKRDLEEKFKTYDQKKIEFEVYQTLLSQERITIKVRKNEMETFLKQLSEKEMYLHNKYKQLIEEKEELQNELALFSNIQA